MTTNGVSREQLEVCLRHGAGSLECPGYLKVGIARNVKNGVLPLNGLRHPPEGDTSGWYIWAGDADPQDDPEFFLPLHVHHLSDWCPEVIRFLGLPPGWRFLTAGEYEDVWEDPSLLNPPAQDKPE